MPSTAKLPDLSYPVPRKGVRSLSSPYPLPSDIGISPKDIRLQVAETMGDECSGRRRQVAAAMTAHLGIPVSSAAVNKWTRPSEPAKQLAAAYLPAWVRATGSTRLLDLICGLCGRVAVTPEVAEAGRLALELTGGIRRLVELEGAA